MCSLLGVSTLYNHDHAYNTLYTGIFPDVLNFVMEYCNGQLFVENEYKKKLVECLAFLRALACKNTAIQTK